MNTVVKTVEKVNGQPGYTVKYVRTTDYFGRPLAPHSHSSKEER